MFPVLKWEAANVRHFPGLFTDILDKVELEMEVEMEMEVKMDMDMEMEMDVKVGLASWG